MSNIARIFDGSLLLKDAGLIAASGACQVSSADKILDLGAGIVTNADIVIDASAVEVGSGNEIYTIGFQVSDSATFATGVYQVAALSLGHASALVGDTNMVEGRYALSVNNMIADGTAKRYARLYVTVGGTIATGINFTAWLSKE